MKKSVKEARAGLIPANDLVKQDQQAAKPYALVTVYGGVAEIALTEGGAEVDILDFDNMQSTNSNDLVLSDKEWEYLKENNSELFRFFAPSYATKDE